MSIYSIFSQTDRLRVSDGKNRPNSERLRVGAAVASHHLSAIRRF